MAALNAVSRVTLILINAFQIKVAVSFHDLKQKRKNIPTSFIGSFTAAAIPSILPRFLSIHILSRKWRNPEEKNYFINMLPVIGYFSVEA